MREETTQLEELRQKIEKAEYEAGDASDFLDRGSPNASQKKASEDLIVKMNAEAKSLKLQLRELIANSPREAIEEWVELHAAVLNRILAEPVKDANSKTRNFVARETLEKWEKVRGGELDYISINWHFLKDYKQEAKKFIKKTTGNSGNDG